MDSHSRFRSLLAASAFAAAARAFSPCALMPACRSVGGGACRSSSPVGGGACRSSSPVCVASSVAASINGEGNNAAEAAASAAAASVYKGASSPRITKVTCLQDFLDFLSEDERLCIVKFHASWCKSCQKFGIRYKKLAMQVGDKVDGDGNVVERGRVRFAEIEFTSNAKLCRSLGVKRLPYIHMYRGADGRLCDFSCGPNKFQTVIDKMNEHLGMTKEEIDFNRVMDAGEVLGEEIVARLKKQQQLEAHKQTKQFDL